MAPLKMLIVDDDRTNAAVLSELVEEFGKSDCVSCGSEAIDIFTQELRNGEPYDLIFLDIMMPKITGLHVLKVFRSLEHIAGKPNHSKIVMCTGLDDRPTIINSFHNGADGYIVKPIDYKELISKLNKLFDRG